MLEDVHALESRGGLWTYHSEGPEAVREVRDSGLRMLCFSSIKIANRSSNNEAVARVVADCRRFFSVIQSNQMVVILSITEHLDDLAAPCVRINELSFSISTLLA